MILRAINVNPERAKIILTPELSIKTDAFLQLDEGFILTLQAFYEIKTAKEQLDTSKPDLTKIRPILFWDTDIDKIQWKKEKESVIKRVSERGNAQEKEEIRRLYKL